MVNLDYIVRLSQIQKDTKEDRREEGEALETENTMGVDTKTSFITNEVICWLLINMLLF